MATAVRFLLSVLAALALAVVAAHGLSTTDSAKMAAAEPKAPPAAPRVMSLGRIEPVSEVVRIAAPTAQDSGRIAEIRVAEGEWVQKGQVIATLDSRARLEAALEQADATLVLREANLAKTIADIESQEKTLAAAFKLQESQRDRAKWDHDRLEHLQKTGLYRDTALIDKRLALDGANQSLESARVQLERNQRLDAMGQRIDEASARAEVAAARAALLRAQADLEFSTLRSPIDGRVLRRLGRVGEQIGQDGLMEIADTRVMMVRSEVFETDLRRVSIGAPVSISSRALSEHLTGVVDRIGLKVNRQTIIGEDPATSLDARVIEVMIRLDGPSSQRASSLTELQVRVSFSSEVGS